MKAGTFSWDMKDRNRPTLSGLVTPFAHLFCASSVLESVTTQYILHEEARDNLSVHVITKAIKIVIHYFPEFLFYQCFIGHV